VTDEPGVAAARVVSPYNPANVLTVLRIVLVPVFVVVVVASGLVGTGPRIAACLVFCGASATDYVDGWIARRWSMVTSFGKVADPIADKALTGTALILLSAYDRLPWWITLVILAREWGVTALRFWVIRYGIIPASRGGKLKTVLQIAAIAWYLWPVPDPLDGVGPWLMTAALIVTVITGADYVVQALRLRRA
jgi:CDP-diacylglycerol--glycerol-3-phosphate 3-phosphatidyltransferase